jgi:hypothetical protein
MTGHLVWRKSSFSGGDNGNCVELRSSLDGVRDSKNPSTVLDARVGEFIAAVKLGVFDR